MNIEEDKNSHWASMVYIKIRGMPCPNRCRHCYCCGGALKTIMPYTKIVYILDRARELKEEYPHIVIQMFDEPTVHPQFLNILERLNDLGLTAPGWFIPTNGWGTARMNGAEWRRLKNAGNPELQLTFYGLDDVHDSFAGRIGAYDDLIRTARKAAEHDIGWTAGIVAWPRIVNDLVAIKETIASLAPGCTGAGWFLPSWQGRGRDPELRCRESDRERLKLPAAHFKSECEHLQEILNNDDLSAYTVGNMLCDFISLEILPDMQVLYGGACDSAPPREFSHNLSLGMLTDAGFRPLIHRYKTDPPELLRLLSQTTWRALAERCGDPAGDGIFAVNDLVINKWGWDYMRNMYRRNDPA